MEYLYDFCDKRHFKAENTKKIGILGGTFNPVHLGHTEIALKLREEFALEYVLIIPVGSPPHKHYEIASEQDRINMLKLSTEKLPCLKVCEIECDRDGLTYTVDTMRSLEKKDTTYYYIIGSDTLFDLETWKEIPAICKLTEFICVRRNNASPTAMANEIARLKEAYGANIHISKVTGPDISSTLIRNRIKSNKSVDGLVDARVEEYIRKNGLYK